MDYQEAMAYLKTLQKFGMHLGLQRIRALLECMGNPHWNLPCIHVGGTNGKGSVCAMLSAILSAADYSVGTYISPALHHFSERISVSGEPIPEDDLAAIITSLKPHVTALGKDGDHPTEFEVVTAAAFVYFAHMGVDVVVLEVGLGGRLDSTNIIEQPLVSVITNVGFDHMQILGNTLAEIAWEKAGIIKPGRPVVTGAVHPEALQVIQKRSGELHTPLYILGHDFTAEGLAMSWSGQSIRGQSIDSVYDEQQLALLGEHQVQNCALVLAVIDLLRKEQYTIPEQSVHQALGAAKWPARFEVIQHNPTVVIDGAHNSDGMHALAATLSTLAQSRGIILVLGILADKDWRRMSETAVGFAERIICVTPGSPRALEAETLAQHIIASGKSAESFTTVAQGIDQALMDCRPDDIVCIAGSLVTATEARVYFTDASVRRI